MLDYDIEVIGDTAGEQCWRVTFRADKNFNPEIDTKVIDSTIRDITSILAATKQPVRKPNNAGTTPQEIKTVRHTLAEVSHELSFLHGLTAADGEAPEETFSIDTSELLSRINEADEILEKLEHSHNHDCP